MKPKTLEIIAILLTLQLGTGCDGPVASNIAEGNAFTELPDQLRLLKLVSLRPSAGTRPSIWRARDLNQDGLADLLASVNEGQTSQATYIGLNLQQQGDMLSFAWRRVNGLVEALDLDGDGRPELTQIDSAAGEIKVLDLDVEIKFGNVIPRAFGSGAAEEIPIKQTYKVSCISEPPAVDTIYPSGLPMSTLVHGQDLMADLNQDGRPDVICTREGATSVQFAEGESFSMPQPLDAGAPGAFLDFDRDGLIDALGWKGWADYNNQQKDRLLFHSGASGASLFASGRESIAIDDGRFIYDPDASITFDIPMHGDFNGDGRLDLIRSATLAYYPDSHSAPSELAVLLSQNSPEMFSESTTETNITVHPWTVRTSDLNGDGRDEIVIMGSDHDFGEAAGQFVRVLWHDGSAMSVGSNSRPAFLSEASDGSILVGDFLGLGHEQILVASPQTGEGEVYEWLPDRSN